MPKRVLLSGGGSATYIYDASGVKYKVIYQGGGENKDTEYSSNVIYENGELDKVFTEEGYITFNGSIPTYHYYLTDHLGNNRVVMDQDGTIEQVNHYYPFGGLFDQTAEELQAYKYNGKELDRTYGLDLYDYSARYMDGALGRFTTMDPLSEKYYGVSPYAYCNNNPVRFVDPTGMDWWSTNNQDEIERVLLQLRTGENIDTESFGEQWTRVTDQELADGMGIFDDTSLSFTINGESWENVGYGKNDMMLPYFNLNMNSGYEFEGFDGKHLIGPSMIALGRPLNFLKPHGMLNSKTGSSIASYVLSKAFPINIGKRGADLAQILTGARTTNLGRFIGRLIPVAGVWTTYIDALYSGVAKPNIQQIQKNIINENNPLDGTINPTTGEYYIPGSLNPFGF